MMKCFVWRIVEALSEWHYETFSFIIIMKTVCSKSYKTAWKIVMVDRA